MNTKECSLFVRRKLFISTGCLKCWWQGSSELCLSVQVRVWALPLQVIQSSCVQSFFPCAVLSWLAFTSSVFPKCSLPLSTMLSSHLHAASYSLTAFFISTPSLFCQCHLHFISFSRGDWFCQQDSCFHPWNLGLSCGAQSLTRSSLSLVQQSQTVPVDMPPCRKGRVVLSGSPCYF